MPADMIMSGSQIALVIGNLYCLKRMYGYLLSKIRYASVLNGTETAGYLNLPDHSYDWSYSVCVKVI